MAEEVGWYSIWAMPSADGSPAIRQAMEVLRLRYGGPQFDPHVTVLGAQRLGLAQAQGYLQAACRSLKPYPCHLTRVASGSIFYQCVFMLIDPSPEVTGANLHTKHHFGLDIGTEAAETAGNGYMPHLSLLYADLSEEEKQKAMSEVETEFGSLLFDTSFQVSSLCLYSTDTSDKQLLSWKKVAEYPLEGIDADAEL